MGIRFACVNCGHVLNVKQHLAGKRGICPKCQSRFEIPLESTIERKRKDKDPPEVETDLGIQSATAPAAPTTAATQAAATSPAAAAQPTQPTPSPAPAAPAPSAPPDPIAENLLLQWYVAPPGGTTPYGPAPGDMFRGWITEGRVSADSMVWRQDWSEWRRAGDVLPQLMPTTYIAPAPSYSAPAYSAPTTPAASPAPSYEAPTAFVEPSSPSLMTPGAPSAGTAALIAQRKPKKGTMAIMVVLGLLVIVLTVVAWIVIKGR